jgi:hypothetical protein
MLQHVRKVRATFAWNQRAYCALPALRELTWRL